MSALYFERLAFGGWNVSIIWLHYKKIILLPRSSACVLCFPWRREQTSFPAQIKKSTKRQREVTLSLYFILSDDECPPNQRRQSSQCWWSR